MVNKILISAQELLELMNDPGCVIVDCRFVLDCPDTGYADYRESHIPGAVYAHLDNDLSGPITDTSGRHPLPNGDSFALFLARSGWTPGKLLVAYDDAGGAIATRLWWLMKYFGYDSAALLDGGIPAWWAAGFEVESGDSPVASLPPPEYRTRDELAVSVTEIEASLDSDHILLVDARAPERFSGEIEPIDAVAGRIPGSVNYPFNKNLAPDGRFRTLEEVRDGLLEMAAGHPSGDLVHLCGSGVTACHNIFAAELAGLGLQQLYVGSWSEWIRDPSHPIARSE